MRPSRSCVPLLAVLGALLATPVTPALPVAATGSPSIGPCPALPADNVWNTDISGLPVDSHSAAWIASSGGPSQLIHPDWGPSGGSVPYGIPFQLVDSSHQKVPVTFQYAGESDPGPYPLGPDTPIEGGSGSTGDRHALVVDTSTCTLYETWNTVYSASGSTAGSGAIFSLSSDALRPAGWTSADAAGLPILPGLVRYGEVQAGAIRHAIRFTVQHTDTAYIWPARHQAGSASDPSLPPMGARFRLKSGVDISHFSAQAQVILTAMKHYGLILADNGSNWYFQGDTDPGWSDSVLSELKTVPAGDFEAVDESSLMVDPNSGQARQSVAALPSPTATPIVLHPVPPSPTPLPTPAPATNDPATAAASPTPVLSPTPADTADAVADAAPPAPAQPPPPPATTPTPADPISLAIIAGFAVFTLAVLAGVTVALWRRRRARAHLDT
ncbi:MAG TPA: hypothetical protein VFC09_04350 [Candidatus Dormibacteraeota bacterium]|nr:hypothetical protein [Candidatus Dormibacteraeota bacterium]